MDTRPMPTPLVSDHASDAPRSLRCASLVPVTCVFLATVAMLVLSLLGVRLARAGVLLWGITTIALGTHAALVQRRSRPARCAASVAIAAVAATLVAWVGVVVVSRATHSANFVLCQGHLRDIYGALSRYAEAHDGYLPDSLPQLAQYMDQGQPLDPGIFVCPWSQDTPAGGPTTQAAIRELAGPGHVSYTYLGRGLRLWDIPLGAESVLAYESPGNHPELREGGTNFLFADGHVEARLGAEAKDMLDALHAERTPPKPSHQRAARP